MVINVDNEEYRVYISYPENDGIPFHPVNKDVPPQPKVVDSSSTVLPGGKIKEVISPLKGKFYLTRDSSETPLKVGSEVKTGEVIGYIESMKTYNAVSAGESGKVIGHFYRSGVIGSAVAAGVLISFLG